MSVSVNIELGAGANTDKLIELSAVSVVSAIITINADHLQSMVDTTKPTSCKAQLFLL